MIEILPSILAADFARLGEEIERVERGGAKIIHVDVMDGHFVPNITIGPPVVKSLRKATKLKLDVHLMISDKDKYAPAFVEAGADHGPGAPGSLQASGLYAPYHPKGRGAGGRGAESGDAGLDARKRAGSGGLRANQ